MKFKQGTTYVVKAGIKISEKDKVFLKKHTNIMEHHLIDQKNIDNMDIIIHYFDGYTLGEPLCIRTNILNNNKYNGTSFFTPKKVVYYNCNCNLDIE